MNKKFILSLILGVVLIAGSGPMPSVLAAVSNPEGTCPVMPGRKTKQKFFVDYKGQRIFLCCRSCMKAFKKNPERYFKAVRAD